MTAILLDIDGTLLASNEAHAASWSDALRETGYDIPARTILPLIGMGGDKVMATLVPGLRPDDGALGESIAKKRAEIFLHRYLPACAPTRGTRALLSELKRRGCTLVMATSARGGELKALLRAADIADLIDAAATSDDAQSSKPEPDIVLAALHKGQTDPSKALMIGDTPYDILAARRAGVDIIAVRCGGWHEPELSEATAVYDDPAAIRANLDVAPLTRWVPSRPRTPRAPR